MEYGFTEEPAKWANLGQGAPQADDDIEGSFNRPKNIDISMSGREYGPTAGIKPLRVAVANLYNAHHRQGKTSQYTWENVAIVPGGRAGLIRIAAVLDNAYLGFFIPDYTAYNEMLSLFRNARLALEEGSMPWLTVTSLLPFPRRYPRTMDIPSIRTRLPKSFRVSSSVSRSCREER